MQFKAKSALQLNGKSLRRRFACRKGSPVEKAKIKSIHFFPIMPFFHPQLLRFTLMKKGANDLVNQLVRFQHVTIFAKIVALPPKDSGAERVQRQ